MDILFFAALALFIFYKLSKQLGKIDEDEKKNIEEKLAQKRANLAEVQKIITQAQQNQPQSHMRLLNPEEKTQAEDKILATLNEPTKTNFADILKRCNISADFFVNGAKSAFEMVIKAFSAGDLVTLKFLLSEKIYQGFEAAIVQRKSQEQILVTNLISIEKVEIISAIMIENNASIAIKFVSKQINYITDKSGMIIEGRKDEISILTDIWTFKRDVSSQDPNWIISATSTS